MISSLLCNILIGCFCVVVLSWAVVAIQTVINDFKCEKREEKKAAQDDEYHQLRRIGNIKKTARRHKEQDSHRSIPFCLSCAIIPPGRTLSCNQIQVLQLPAECIILCKQ